jgi:hypothetical protein
MEIKEWTAKKKKLDICFHQETDNSFKKIYFHNKKYSSYVTYSYNGSIYLITILFANVSAVEDSVKIFLKKKINIMGEFFQVEEIESKTFNINENEKIVKFFKKMKIKIKLLEVFIQ